MGGVIPLQRAGEAPAACLLPLPPSALCFQKGPDLNAGRAGSG